MYEFLDRFISIAVPRMRDFRGLPTKSFDGRGNYTVGLKEQMIFPEIDYDKVEKIHGMDITLVTTAGRDDTALALLRELGMPFRGEAPVAVAEEAIGWRRRRGWRRSSGSRSSRCAATTGASGAAAVAGRSGSSGCAAFVSASSRCAGRFPACAKPVGKRTEHEMSMTDPVADMLTRVRNACQAGHRRVDMPG